MTGKVAYEFDENGAYVGQRLWPIDPVETEIAGQNVYLDNNMRTETAPPSVNANQVAVWNKLQQQWTITDDYRGELWFDENDVPTLVVSPGDPQLVGLTREPVEKPTNQDDISASISDSRDRERFVNLREETLKISDEVIRNTLLTTINLVEKM